MAYNVVLVSGAKQTDSVIQMELANKLMQVFGKLLWGNLNELFGHVYNVFFLRFFSIMGYNKVTEYSSLCYTAGPCWLSILYIIACIH